jgi:uncharacterized membrane protein (DUF2068 family)
MDYSEPSTVPLGIKIVCGFGILEVLLGVIRVIGAVGAPPAFVMGVIAIVLIQAAVVSGLWTFKRWGWFGALFLNGLDVVSRIPRLFDGNPRVVVFFLISVGIIVYLVRKRDLYRESTASS